MVAGEMMADHTSVIIHIFFSRANGLEESPNIADTAVSEPSAQWDADDHLRTQHPFPEPLPILFEEDQYLSSSHFFLLTR